MEVLAPLYTSYHCTIAISLYFKYKKAHAFTRTMWDYSGADVDGLRQHVSAIDWVDTCGSFTSGVSRIFLRGGGKGA